MCGIGITYKKLQRKRSLDLKTVIQFLNIKIV